jgi:hypothetical protein
MAREDSVAGNRMGGCHGSKRRELRGQKKSVRWQKVAMAIRVGKSYSRRRQEAGPLDDRKLGFMAAEDENSLRQKAGCHGNRRRALFGGRIPGVTVAKGFQGDQMLGVMPQEGEVFWCHGGK